MTMPAIPAPPPRAAASRRDSLVATGHRYAYAFLDEGAKREIRRKLLKAVAIPGCQVPFGSREMPIARGWGTGGLQLTLTLIGPRDVLKVIDQGADDSVNAVNIKKFVHRVTDVAVTVDTAAATLIQTRHRIPETPLRAGQILVFQVPIPEPLRLVEPSERRTRRMHAEGDYSRMWLYLYEDIVKYGEITVGARYPVMVNGRHLMDPSPIPRWDLPKLNQADALFLFCAGREKRIYAVPPIPPWRPSPSRTFPFAPRRSMAAAASAAGPSAPSWTRPSTTPPAGGATPVQTPFSAIGAAGSGMRPFREAEGRRTVDTDPSGAPTHQALRRGLRGMRPAGAHRNGNQPVPALPVHFRLPRGRLRSVSQRGAGHRRRERVGQKHRGAPAAFRHAPLAGR
jgi:alpha-D-ribose 1-methylphosphonate 5-phosphate C-P lyase